MTSAFLANATAKEKFQNRLAMCLRKKRYQTKSDAMRIATIRLQDKNNPPDFLRAYRCPVCKGYHLTHRE